MQRRGGRSDGEGDGYGAEAKAKEAAGGKARRRQGGRESRRDRYATRSAYRRQTKFTRKRTHQRRVPCMGSDRKAAPRTKWLCASRGQVAGKSDEVGRRRVRQAAAAAAGERATAGGEKGGSLGKRGAKWKARVEARTMLGQE
jgi:hypothetical protein